MIIGFGLAEHLAGEDADTSRTLMHAVDLDLSDARSYYFLASLKHIPPELMKGVTARFAQYAARYPKRADAQYYYASNLWSSNEALNQPQNYAEIECRLRAALALGEAVPIDPQGSLMDADMGAFYIWLNQRRLPRSEEATFVVWFENHSEALMIAQHLTAGTESHSPLSFEDLLRPVSYPHTG